MNLKEFLKPNKEKLILALVLLVVSSVAFRTGPFTAQHMGAVPEYLYGFPLQFVSVSDSMNVNFNFPNDRVILFSLAIDIIFWYLVSSLAIMFFRKYFIPSNVKERKRK